MSEPLPGGELELRTEPPPADLPAPEVIAPAVEQPAAEPAAAEPEPAAAEEPTGDVVAEPEPAPEPAKVKKPGLVEELIAERTLRKQAEGTLKNLQPVLSRLTPEVQEAITEGRLVVRPREASPDAEAARLKQVADDLGLYKDDNTPDLEAARKVDRYVRTAVKQEVAPLHHDKLAAVAQGNIDAAIKYAEENGFDVDTVRETYAEVMSQPNGAAMLSQAKVAETIWHQAVGRAVNKGRLPKPKAAPVKDATPAAVIAEPSGRRGAPTATIQLSPALQKVYRDNGVDPAKVRGAGKLPVVDARGSMELE